MKISCPACGAKYTIADDKVRGRRVKIRCKSCSSPIIVEPGSAQAAAAAPAPAPAQQSAPVAPPGNGSSEVWSINLSDTDQRTMTTEEIVAGWRAGVVTDDAFVWKDGMGDWVPILEMPELRALIEAPNQAPPASAPASARGAGPQGAAAATTTAAATSARRAGGRAQGTTDLFGGVATAGSESDLATSAATLPGSTAYDAKPTGARNENSVLFSLDSLKVGFGGPTPSPAQVGTRPEPQARRAYSQPDDPFGMSAGNSGVAKLGGGGMNPLFGSDNQALLFAPPPPPEPRPVVRADPLAGQFADLIAPPPSKMPSKRVLAIGGGIGVLVLIGVIALAMSGGEKPTADATEAIRAEVKKEEEKPRPKPEPEVKKDEPEKPAETEKTSATSEKKEPTAEDKKRYVEAQKKKAETKSTEEKTETTLPPSSGDGPPFNKGAAVSALTSASSAASGCKRPGGPTGAGKVTVTFAPNGRVTQSSVSGGSYGGSPVGGCVASVFRRAKIPAFSGNAVTVSKSFNISP